MGRDGTELATIAQATRMLAECRSLSDVVDLRDKAAAVLHYAKAAQQGLEAQNHAAEIKLRAERRAGELLSAMEKKKHRHSTPTTMGAVTIADIGITYNQSSRWQQEAAVPEETFMQWVAAAIEEKKELTQSGLLKLAKGGTVAAAANTGEIEWYTPVEFIDMARDVMGSIDVDPASSHAANETVGATVYYTEETDGLAQDWKGNVWMNPPYRAGVVNQFTAKLQQQIDDGHAKQAIVLVNNATDTAWFYGLTRRAQCVCFKTGRIAFINTSGEAVAGAAQGQVFLYFGKRIRRFLNVFGTIGWVAEVRG